MPVFHTKTIESILEPVAQQVSKLVILHEEAEDGNAMPDLSKPVQVVKIAVDNLVKVGYETINNSEDQIFKKDMPPALSRVEDSSMFLLDASHMLKEDPYSASARKKLIEGSRGILQGTSALLLAFDESEVRKIIRVCKNVLEYLAITEVVDNLEDLVTFVKNLSPILTKMAKEVDTREKELTHQIHREWLQRSLEQVRQLTPALISSIKIYITTRNEGGTNSSVDDATSSRNYVNSKMSDEINEIVRVLQLTSYDEEEWDVDDVTIMKKAQNAIDGKIKQALNWLYSPDSLINSAGAHSLKSVMDNGLKIGKKSSHPEEEEAIIKSVSNINSMVDALCELKQQGEGNSPQALSLARGIQQLVKDLQNRCQKIVVNTDRDQAQKPAHTVVGKLEQAQRWLADRVMDDKGLGRKACKLIIEDGLKMSEESGQLKDKMLLLCKEAESLSNLLEDLSKNDQGHSQKAANTAALLSAHLQQIKDLIQDGLVEKVAEDFLDISTPLKLLNDAAMGTLGTLRKEEHFEEKANNFAQHGHKMTRTAIQLATAGTCHDRRTVEEMQSSAQRVEDLLPHVVKAARIVLNNPTNQASVDHFELLKKQWTDNVEKLRGLIDDAVDADSFIKENEEGILADTSRAEQFISNLDPTGIVNATSRIARRSHRILQVAQSEADNSEDPCYVELIQDSIIGLRGEIAPVIQSAKVLAQNPRDSVAISGWRAVNQELIKAVTAVRKAVSERGGYPKQPEYLQMPALSYLKISRPDLGVLDYCHQHPNYFNCSDVPPIPPSPTIGGYCGKDFGEAPFILSNSMDVQQAPPRPPPPETDDEFESAFPAPQHNQPIMMAAHALHMDVKQWSSRDNELIAAAKKMALLMARLSQLVRGEGGSKRDLIDCARAIAEASEEVTSLAKQLAHECTDKRMRMSLLQVCERIPTMGTQLKILSTVKATMLGAQGSDEDHEATEMLVGNAQNLMQSVRETVLCAEAASIKIRVDSGYTIRWIRRRPWYI